MNDEQKRGSTEAQKIVSKMFEALAVFSSIASEDLKPEQREEHVKKVCHTVAYMVATMPCIQVAMGIGRPEMDPRDRYCLVVYQIISCFGFNPEDAAGA